MAQWDLWPNDRQNRFRKTLGSLHVHTREILDTAHFAEISIDPQDPPGQLACHPPATHPQSAPHHEFGLLQVWVPEAGIHVYGRSVERLDPSHKPQQIWLWFVVPRTRHRAPARATHVRFLGATEAIPSGAAWTAWALQAASAYFAPV